MKKLLLAVALVIAFGAGQASAGLLTITAGSTGMVFGQIPEFGTNQALPIFGIPVGGPGYGWYGGVITGTPGATYKYEVYGAEASYFNKFYVGTDLVYDHPGGDTLSPVIKATFFSDSLAFAFLTGPGVLVTNDLGATGNVIDQPGTGFRPNFFASFDLQNAAGNQLATGDVVRLFLDDGATSDDNHDDLVVRITAIPEPGTLLLLGAGLLGLAGASRRRR